MKKAAQKKQSRPDKVANTMYNIFWCLLLATAIVGSAFHLERHKFFDDERAALEQQLAKQQDTNDLLRKDLTLFGSDAYIERTASERLGLVKPDEVVYYSNED